MIFRTLQIAAKRYRTSTTIYIEYKLSEDNIVMTNYKFYMIQKIMYLYKYLELVLIVLITRIVKTNDDIAAITQALLMK